MITEICRKDNLVVPVLAKILPGKLKNNNVQPLSQSWLTKDGVKIVLGQQNTQTGYEDCRTSVREDVDAEILLHQSGGKTHRATLVNISATGFKMTSMSGLDPSKPVFIRLPGLPILAANVRWEGFSDFGCEFARPLEAHVMEVLLKKLKGQR
ncbi:MAG: PilZ domain-containing protein [Pseudomonadota bacterium]